MPESFPVHHQSLEQLTSAYLLEANGLSRLVLTPYFHELVKQHGDYNQYLLQRKTHSVKDFDRHLQKMGGGGTRRAARSRLSYLGGAHRKLG